MEKNNKLPLLNGAEKDNFVTRFAPEAGGSLHLGHLKAHLLNYLYTKEYNGKIILRFDDTNPEKEKQEFETAILEDLKFLGLECDSVTYTSDYFDQIINYATVLINKGLAYIDFTDKKEINKLRAEFKVSPYRDQLTELNLYYFKQMQMGELDNCCLRAKIDYASKNGCMRDPVIFRCKKHPHPRHGTVYKIYPTYDFACPIIDSLQGVTHAMRNIEYRDRDAQYNWFLDNLELKNGVYPLIMDYGKMSFSHSVLAKRKLAQLINAGLVSDWTDPRLPTIRGVIRRGIEREPLIEYIKTQITSHHIVLLSWDKLYSFNLAHQDKNAKRLYGLNHDRIPISLEGNIPEFVNLANHPKNKSFGERKIFLSNRLLVDKDDFKNVTIGSRFTLVGLGNTSVTSIEPLVLSYDPNDKDFRSTTKITWLPDDNKNILVKVKRFGNLLTKPKLEENEDIISAFNRDSVTETEWLLEESIKSFPVGSIVQVMRKEFCYIDKNSNDGIVLHIIPKS